MPSQLRPSREANSESRLHVACACDREYVPHTAAMLHSLLCQHRDARIHLLHGPDLPPDAGKRLQEMVESQGGAISLLLVEDGRVAGLIGGDVPLAAPWYRLFLPQLVPELDRVLYLDSDVIVRASLASLWATDLDDSYLGAVTNVFRADQVERVPRLGLADPNEYFNTGVLLMNLDRMRRDDCMTEVAAWAAKHPPEPIWHEQDALNLVLGPRRLPLHPRWNCMSSFFSFPWSARAFGEVALAAARSDPAIRHFEGPRACKPWHYLCDRPMRRVYFEHRHQTPWPRVELEGRTPWNVVRRIGGGLRTRLRRAAGSRPRTAEA